MTTVFVRFGGLRIAGNEAHVGNGVPGWCGGTSFGTGDVRIFRRAFLAGVDLLATTPNDKITDARDNAVKAIFKTACTLLVPLYASSNIRNGPCFAGLPTGSENHG